MHSQAIERSYCCHCWQGTAVLITALMAITALAIGILHLNGVQYDFHLFKLEDLTSEAAWGILGGGAAALTLLIGGTIYFSYQKSSLSHSSSATSQQAKTAPKDQAPPSKAVAHPAFTFEQIDKETFITRLDDRSLIVELEAQEADSIHLAEDQMVIYRIKRKNGYEVIAGQNKPANIYRIAELQKILRESDRPLNFLWPKRN